jgi:hypothetical protein
MSAACPKFDMVWLHRSPTPVGMGGGGRFSNDFYLPCYTRRGRGGGRHLVVRLLAPSHLRHTCVSLTRRGPAPPPEPFLQALHARLHRPSPLQHGPWQVRLLSRITKQEIFVFDNLAAFSKSVVIFCFCWVLSWVCNQYDILK